MVRNTYSSLGTGGTVQAVHADLVVANHILTLTGCPPLDVRLIESMKVTASNAETAGVWTITPTNAASSNFEITITQFVFAYGTTETVTLSVNTLASGSSATTICDEWRAQLANYTNLSVTATGTATLVLTTKANSPLMKVTQTSTGSAIGTISIVNTTPGVVANGKYTQLVALGVPASILVSGQSYTAVQFTARVSQVNDPAGETPSQRIVHTCFINEGATNFAALNTYIGEVQLGYVAGGTTADPTFIAPKGA